jgi:dipeptidyl aminopeptidase/acylaminoacyl peptidase
LSDGHIQSLATTEAAESMPVYSPDGQSIAFAASDIPATWAGARRLQVMAATGGKPLALKTTYDEFGRYSEIVGWSPDGKQIYFTEMHGTNYRIMAMPIQGSPVTLREDSGMSLSGVTLNATRTHFGYAWEQLDQPAEARLLPTGPGEPITITQVGRALNAPPLGKTEVIRWKSTDGTEVEGLLTRPIGFSKETRYPLLVVIHGGPMGVFTQTYDGTANTYPIAAFASQGYLVLRANVRGSSGYGRKFRYANYGDWGGGDFQDLMSGVDHVIGLGIVDSWESWDGAMADS